MHLDKLVDLLNQSQEYRPNESERLYIMAYAPQMYGGAMDKDRTRHRHQLWTQYAEDIEQEALAPISCTKAGATLTLEETLKIKNKRHEFSQALLSHQNFSRVPAEVSFSDSVDDVAEYILTELSFCTDNMLDGLKDAMFIVATWDKHNPSNLKVHGGNVFSLIEQALSIR